VEEGDWRCGKIGRHSDYVRKEARGVVVLFGRSRSIAAPCLR